MSVGCSFAKPFVTNRNSIDQEMQFEMSRANENDGQLAKAETAYRSLCDAQPKVARYHQRYGIVLARTGKLQEGLSQLETARRLESNNTEILNDLGYAYLQSGEPVKAAELFKQALKLDAQNQRANNNLALAVGYDGDLKESFRIFRSTMLEAEALANLGYLAIQNNRTDLAVKAYSRTLTLEPDNTSAAEALTQLALMDRDIVQTRSLANDLNSVHEESPDDLPAFLRDRASSVKPANMKQTMIPVSHNAPQKKSVTQTTAANTSPKFLLSERDE